MARKALLIGSQIDGLTGVGNDIGSMANALDRWGFTSVRCEAENASRAGILDAYERLIADAERPGRGGHLLQRARRLRPPAGRRPSSSRPAGYGVQFIVPTDYHSSTEDDFRGITSVELSVLLARLTEKTKNATVVLDCCHAAHMSRGPRHDGEVARPAGHRPASSRPTWTGSSAVGNGSTCGLRRATPGP